MLKLCLVAFYAISFISCAHADNYIVGGVGAGETCATKSEPSFSGGQCRQPSLLLRGALGAEANEFFVLEGSLDGLVSSILPREYSHSTDDRVSVLTIGLHGFAVLPVTNVMRLFAGPSVGVSMARVSINTQSWYNNSTHETETADDVDTEFGVNYGWAAGLDIGELNNGIVRIQWQNWRSLDSKVAYGGEFNTNYLSVNFITRY